MATPDTAPAKAPAKPAARAAEAHDAPVAVGADALLALQRMAGNQAVLRLQDPDLAGAPTIRRMLQAPAQALVQPPQAPPNPFAGVAGWSAGNLTALNVLYQAGNGGLAVNDWIAIASAHAALVDRENDVAVLARAANGWNAGGLTALAALFGAAPGLTAAQWVAIATANAALANQHATVGAFAAIANGWTPAAIATLAGLFGAAAGGQAAAVWVAIANAHADLTDQHATVAALARAAWTGVDVTAFVGAFRAAGASAPNLLTLLGVAGTAAAARGLVGAGWSAANAGTYVGATIQAGVTPANTAAFIATGGVAAASFLMLAGGWVPTTLGQYTGAALVAGATAAHLAGQMGTALFPATSFGLISGAWTATSVGTFCGAAARAACTAAELQATIVAVGAPAALRAMTTGLVTLPDLGTYAGTARHGGVPAAYLVQLMSTNTFPAATVAMRAAGWTAAQFGEFTIGANAQAATAVGLTAIVALGGFPAGSFPWIGAGFTATEVGQVTGRAMAVGAPPADVDSYMRQAGMAAAAAALRAAWGAAELGNVIGRTAISNNGPTEPELALLLPEALTAVNHGGPIACTAATVIRAVTAAPGGMNWASVTTNMPIWVASYAAPAAADNGGVLHTITIAGTAANTQVTINVTDWLRHHVEARHTIDNADMSVAILNRQGPNGRLSFYAAGTAVGPLMAALTANAAVQTLAKATAVAGGWQSGPVGGAKAGTNVVGGWSAPDAYGVTTQVTSVTQYYPTPGAVTIKGRDAIAMGRALGLTP